MCKWWQLPDYDRMWRVVYKTTESRWMLMGVLWMRQYNLQGDQQNHQSEHVDIRKGVRSKQTGLRARLPLRCGVSFQFYRLWGKRISWLRKLESNTGGVSFHPKCNAIYTKIHSTTLLFLQFCRLRYLQILK